MQTDAYNTFINMFLSLDAYWDEHRDETIAGFLSEANPYLFKDKGSADPAVWLDFSSLFAKQFLSGRASLRDAHTFVQKYLVDMSEEYSKAYPGGKRLDEAFAEIASLNRWEEAFEFLEEE